MTNGLPYSTQGGFPAAWVAGVGSMGNGYMDLVACDRCGLTGVVPTITAHSIITLRLSHNQLVVRLAQRRTVTSRGALLIASSVAISIACTSVNAGRTSF